MWLLDRLTHYIGLENAIGLICWAVFALGIVGVYTVWPSLCEPDPYDDGGEEEVMSLLARPRQPDPESPAPGRR